MSAHTPGPWECPNLDDDYSSRQGWITTTEGALIASMEPSDNQEADARLIAAAPELLEACRQLLALCSLKWGNRDANVTAYMDKVETILAKATGEQA